MRLIDADELDKVKFHELPYTHIVPADLPELQTEAYERGWNDAIDAITESAGTIDAVLVVRCKDCKYYVPDGDGVPGGGCTMTYSYMPEDGYCSDGERKEDDETD